MTKLPQAQIDAESNTRTNKTHLLIGREVALGLLGITTLPAPSWALVDQFVTGGNEFFRRQHSTAEEGRRLESWGGPFSDGFEIRCHILMLVNVCRVAAVGLYGLSPFNSSRYGQQ